jgi:hypothetical protein
MVDPKGYVLASHEEAQIVAAMLRIFRLLGACLCQTPQHYDLSLVVARPRYPDGTLLYKRSKAAPLHRF